MTRACRNPACTLLAGGRCARAGEFADPARECPELVDVSGALDAARVPGLGDIAAQLLGAALRASETRTTGAPTLAPPALAPPVTRGLQGDPTPWSGRHLDRGALAALQAQRPVRLVGLLGPAGVGKTCLLASTFLQLASGRRPGFPWRFAGSQSLQAFHGFAHRAAGWQGAGGEALDRTQASEAADAGLFLHLALRPEASADDRVVHLALADLPGEWCTELSRREDAQTLGRVDFLSRCGALLVLADAGRLTGPQANQHDSEIATLLDRAAQITQATPRPPALGLVFTKLDAVPDLGALPAPGAGREAWGRLARARRLWAAVDRLRARGPAAPVHGVAALPRPLADGQPWGVTELWGQVLAALEPARPAPAPPPPPPPGRHPFLYLRRQRPAEAP